MAYNVKFLQGTAEQYAALQEKNGNTFYLIGGTDLYLGNIKLSNGADLATAVGRIDVLEALGQKLDGAENVEGSVRNLIAAAKAELNAKIGDLAALNTENKTNLVVAINEVRQAVETGGTGSVVTLTTAETATEGYAKTYVLKQGGSDIGTIDIPKDMVVSAGTVEVKAEAGDWGEAGTYIHLVLANATNDDLYINVGTLVDLYTAEAEAAKVQLTIDNSTRVVSATIVAGAITATELADNAVVTAKIADANVTEAKIADANITTAKIADANVTKAKLAEEVVTSLGKADTALQEANITTGATAGTIKVNETEVAVAGLGGAAYKAADYYEVAGAAATVKQEAAKYTDEALTWGTME